MKNARRLGQVVMMAIGLAGLGAAGCNEVDEALDCAQVCDRYKTCIGGEKYNESACRASCTKYVDENPNTEDNLDECAGCLDTDMTCGQSAWKCSAKCAAILPATVNP